MTFQNAANRTSGGSGECCLAAIAPRESPAWTASAENLSQLLERPWRGDTETKLIGQLGPEVIFCSRHGRKP